MPRSRRRSRFIGSFIATVAVVLCVASCNRNKTLGPPDSYALFVAKSATGRPLAVERADVKTPAVQPLPGLFETGFASEMLRTVYLAGQFLRDATIAGQRFPDQARTNASFPVCLVVGAEIMPYGRGLSFSGTFGGAVERPEIPWVGLPADLGRDKALVQTITAHLATYAAHLIATGGLLDAASPPPDVLIDGYRMAMEVVAREWRFSSGPAGVIQTDEGTTEQRALFGNVRDNRFIVDETSGGLRPARQLLESGGVAATILYRMAQSRAIGPRVAPEAFYAPYAANRMPAGVSPAAILGTFRNFQAKLFGVWATAVLRGKAPNDIVDLVEAYAATFPAERAEVIRVFVVTTFGGTVKAGGSSMAPEDAQHTLAELTALAAEVTLGRRTLRDALKAPPEK
jgi:hypothetical protein